MIPAKTWEGRTGDVWPRRFAMLAAGLVLGAAAFGLQEAMQVQLPYEMRTGAPWVQRTTPPEFHGISGVPRLPTYLAYFGFLFVILRWWRQAEPRRATRLSVWLVVCCLFWAWLLDRFWAFPQPWGVMTAAVVAITVQLASPWKGRRREEEA